MEVLSRLLDDTSKLACGIVYGEAATPVCVFFCIPFQPHLDQRFSQCGEVAANAQKTCPTWAIVETPLAASSKVE